MKKLLFIIFVIPMLGFGQWTENFDSGTNNTIPAGWTVINNGDPNGWKISGPNGQTGNGDNAAVIETSTTAHDDYLITKAINVQLGVSNRISFFVYGMVFNMPTYEKYEVLLSTTNQTSAAFTTVLQPEQQAPFSWTKKVFDLSPYAGQTVYIAIHATDSQKYKLLVDTFVVDTIPTVVPPCNSISSPTNDSVGISLSGILTWPAVPSATGYRLKVGTTSGGTNVVNDLNVQNVTTYDIPGNLNTGTTYYATIVPYNEIGNASGCTQISFTTGFSPANDSCVGALTASSLPYSFTQSDGSFATNNSGFITTCSSGMNDGTWFKFVGDGSTVNLDVSMPNGSNFDAMIGVFAGNCTSLTCVGTSDDGGAGGAEHFSVSTNSGTTYYVNVGSYGDSSDDPEDVFTIKIAKNGTLSSVDILETNETTRISPNPFTDVINISKADLVKSVSVSDVSGRLVKTIDNPSSALHLGDLKQGLYFVTLNMKDGSKQTIKAIKK
ncbi:choice-of-anchor J domain-containing protein [Chryseobacterium kwangjuense]|uniref:Choice-of-anchor J domain-containing protein n=1 Tax=Chryseobacterium kwangjuense TaxID=267125 RepID=A0ABW9K3A4_9FLAO